jgi:hypothetical protein
MKCLLSVTGFVSSVLFAGTALGQGYTVMNGTPPATPDSAPTVVAQPAVNGVVPDGTVGQITPSRERAPRTLGGVVTARRAGEYGGITPGMPSLPPGLRRVRRGRAGGVPYITWPGFQMVAGGSRAFVVLTSAQPVTEGARNGRVRTYHIPGARILLWNNHRPLITEAFETPLVRASLRSVRGGTDLLLELRADVEPSITQETNGQGFHYVFFNFPTFSIPTSGRIQLPGGSITPVAAPPTQPVIVPAPQIVVGQPQSRPGTDTERPPGVR